jgi:hypothetical protein
VMIYIKRIIIFNLICFCVVWTVSTVYAQDEFYVTLGNSRSRALSMGGAFIAVEDDNAAISFNPAAFNVRRDSPGTRLAIDFNPVLGLVSLNQSDNFSLTEDEGFGQALGSLLYFVRTISLSTSVFNFGLHFNEEIAIDTQSDKFFDGRFFEDNVFHTAVANIRLSSSVTLGVSGSLIRSTENGKKIKGGGINYGILLKPNNRYQVGIMFNILSTDVRNARRKLDRIANESVNVGLTFFPWSNMTVSIDARNVTEGSKPDGFALQEFHFGLENTQIKHVSLRGGFYKEKNGSGTDSNIFSAGIGLIDLNRFKRIGNRLSHPTSLLSYGILFENNSGQNFRWHMLTVQFRL